MKKLKVYAGMATCKGREEAVKDAIDSIKGQVDYLSVYDNTKSPNIGDAGKFSFLRRLIGEDAIYLSLDDDLIYPPDYVKEIRAWFKYNEKNDNKPFDILTFHGRTLISYPAKDYYSDPCSVRVRCLGDGKGEDVEVGGTGVMAFKCNLFKEMPTFEKKNAADIAIAGYAKRNGWRIYAAPHKAGWIKHTDKIDLKETIYFTADRKEITEYYNRVMK